MSAQSLLPPGVLVALVDRAILKNRCDVIFDISIGLRAAMDGHSDFEKFMILKK